MVKKSPMCTNMRETPKTMIKQNSPDSYFLTNIGLE